jgi:hypothetical protein
MDPFELQLKIINTPEEFRKFVYQAIMDSDAPYDCDEEESRGTAVINLLGVENPFLLLDDDNLINAIKKFTPESMVFIDDKDKNQSYPIVAAYAINYDFEGYDVNFKSIELSKCTDN